MPIGLYIHVPFCLSKCPYCDFYSLPLAGDDGLLDRYTASVEQALDRWADRLRTPADTLYFGGGTPSLLGGKRLDRQGGAVLFPGRRGDHPRGQSRRRG